MTSQSNPPAPHEDALPCPECSTSGSPGRIGSRRADCLTCNRWAQSVRREVDRILRTENPDLHQGAKARAEVISYQKVTMSGGNQ